ncbi:MAG TPA: NAD(P)/FAD-dependent oxidoreductase [Cytophagales bacterium]|nr:NAD(P)/FAD-dependent oxidoreductase [Cytophagales bacterium]
MNLTIIGGGLVGSLLSISLKKRGYHDVHVFEKRPDIRYHAESRGRSINMALSDRGWKALESVDLAAQVQPHCIPMYGRMIHQIDGTEVFQPYGKENQAINSISRNLLTKILVEASLTLGTSYSFDHKCIDINLKSKELTFESPDSTQPLKYKYERLFGTDGAYSEVRTVLTKTERFAYRQWYLEHGYKELHIPAHKDSHKIEKNALHIWPRGHFMLIALPNTDGSFTCTLFLPFEGQDSFESINTETELYAFFTKNFPDALELMPDLANDYFHNPTSALINVHCWPWSYQDSVLLMGDAAHSIVPFYGQGMNAGFEDVRIFDMLLDKEDWNTVFKTFEKSRKENTEAIAQMALDNFTEMRDKVGDKQFLLKKKIDAWLHEKYGQAWVPLYTMVTFAPEISYKQAQTKGLQQDALLEQILKIPNIENNWKNLDYSKFIQ